LNNNLQRINLPSRIKNGFGMAHPNLCSRIGILFIFHEKIDYEKNIGARLVTK